MMRLHPLLLLQSLLLLGTFAAAFSIIPQIPWLQALTANSDPTVFTAQTDCNTWLRQKHDKLLYPFGRNESTSGAEALMQCLARDEAAGYRSMIKDIYVIYPSIGTARNDHNDPLKRIIEMLPASSLTVHWPYRLPCDHRVPSRSFEEWRAAEQGQRVESRIGYSWGSAHNWGDDRSLPTFHECGVPSVVYDGDGAPKHLDRIYDHMRRCDDVRELRVSMHQGGCVIQSDRRSFDWQPGDTFPSRLESLTLSGYDWDQPTPSGLSAAQAWASAMDWAHLKRLDITRPSESFVAALAGRLSGLESLTIRPAWHFWGDELTFCRFDANATATRRRYVDFIASMPPLRELSIAGMGELLELDPILAVHGQTLRRLSIHEFERDCAFGERNSSWTRPVLNAAQLQRVNEAAPHLESLALDLDRSGAMPDSELELLSTFPSLRELTLHFALEDPGRSYVSKRCAATREHAAKYCNQHYLMEPRLNVSTAADILGAVRGSGRSDGGGVAKLVVTVGDYNRREGGGMRVHFLFDPNEPSRFECDWDITGNARCAGSGWDGLRPVEEHMLDDWDLLDDEDELYGY